jgi:hypothetical protein
MKNTILYLLVILFLLQSCTTYRTIDLSKTPLKLGEMYKIRQEDKFIKGKLRTIYDSTITVVVDKNEQIILLPEVNEIKQRKISALKTVGLILSILVIGGGIYVANDLSKPWGTFDLNLN